MSKSTAKQKTGKPYPDFPLTPHPTGRWCKKINGKLHYFGYIKDGWQEALDRYQQQRDDLYAGRTPRAGGNGLTVRDLVNRFMTAKTLQRDSGELTPVSFRDYYVSCDEIQTAFGKPRLVQDLAADDFAKLRAQYAKALKSPVSVANKVRRVRIVFKWAYDNGLIDKPVRWGTGFQMPSTKTLRLAKAKKPARLFTAEEIRSLIGKASTVQMRAAILLGINCALGNHDIAELPIAALSLNDGILNYPRPKTGIDRQAVLWPETAEAVRAALAKRKEPKDEADKGLLFITKFGHRYIQIKPSKKQHADGRLTTSVIDSIALEFGKLLDTLSIDRAGVGFYSLRHTFRTIADDAGDDRAVDRVMGHHREADIANAYRHAMPIERLQRVAQHVHDWLFPPETSADDQTAEAEEH